MKHIRILHNPDAGDTSNSYKSFMKKLTKLGFKCRYNSTKETDEEDFISSKDDIIAIIGGDGTVRKLAGQLVNRKIINKKLPIALLPSGTANNIAKTLAIEGSETEIIERWKSLRLQPIDLAEVSGIPGQNFVLEGLGFGIFPKLMQKMKAIKNKPEDVEGELKLALKIFSEIIKKERGRRATLIIDDKSFENEYLMIEIMNIRYIGPNLNIAQAAAIDDGLLDVVLVPVQQRKNLIAYIRNYLLHGDEEFCGKAIQAQSVTVQWNGKLVHVDDQLIKLKKKSKVRLEVRKGILEFLT